MSVVLPQAGDVLSADNHARLHRCVASDSAAPDQSITVNAAGNVVLLQPLVFPDASVQSTAAAGTVTSVGATAPLASSGGTTPTISFTGILSTGNGGTGTLASVNTANGVVKLDGSGRLPAIDGSQLTGIVSFVTGMILMWSGSIASIPSGWLLCNGSSGTPDLRNMFIVGANADVGGVAKSTITGSALQTGGEATHTLTIPEMPAHTHTVSIHDQPGGGNNVGTYTDVSPNTSLTTDSTGGGGAHNNIPPFYALAFIMKS